MRHIMIDIETAAATNDAAVLSVGLCEFDPATQAVGRTLELRATFESMRVEGRRFDPATMEWWLRQNQAAQKQLLRGPRHDSAKEMAEEIRDFLLGIESNQWQRGVWAKDPTFDCAILRSLFEDVGVDFPVHFSREYSVRTMLLIAKANGWKDILDARPEVEHGALSDATHQAKQVMAIMERLKR